MTALLSDVVDTPFAAHAHLNRTVFEILIINYYLLLLSAEKQYYQKLNVTSIMEKFSIKCIIIKL